MADPLVSVIIANHNYAAYLSQAIDSVLTAGDAIELIVVDDGSRDDSRALISRYGTQIRSILQANAGACAARNAGLAIARGSYVKFLDADDWLAPDAVTRQLAEASALPPDTKAAVFGDAIWVTEDGLPTSGPGLIADYPQTFDLSRMIKGPPLTSAPLHRRTDVLSIGGFDERVRRGQEHDLHVRLALSGVTFHYRPGPVYFYRQHRSTGRISLTNGSAGASVLAASLRHVTIAQEAGLMTPHLAEAFAHRIWQQGRETLQRGSPDIARDFFTAARTLCPTAPMPGPWSYRTLVHLIGPMATERLSRARSLLHHGPDR